MAKLSTREQAIRKRRQLHNLQAITSTLQRLGTKTRTQRKEIFVDTRFGKVRPLWYGFENRAKAPVYFDLHGGGFIFGTADMDESMNLEFMKQVGCNVSHPKWRWSLMPVTLTQPRPKTHMFRPFMPHRRIWQDYPRLNQQVN